MFLDLVQILKLKFNIRLSYHDMEEFVINDTTLFINSLYLYLQNSLMNKEKEF